MSKTKTYKEVKLDNEGNTLQQSGSDVIDNIVILEKREKCGNEKTFQKYIVFGLLASLCLVILILIGVIIGFQLDLTTNNETRNEEDLVHTVIEEDKLIFETFDSDDDGRLNLFEFTQFISVTGYLSSSFNEIASAFDNGDDNIITVHDYVSMLSYRCFDDNSELMESCKTLMNSPICIDIIDFENEDEDIAWQQCIELVAYGSIMKIRGDEDAIQISKQEFINATAAKIFDNIQNGTNDGYINIGEFIEFQNQYAVQFEETLKSEFRFDGNKCVLYEHSTELKTTPDQIDELKRNMRSYNNEYNQKRRSRSLLSGCEYDCDWYDVLGCDFHVGVCAAACASIVAPACVACFISAGSGWCYDMVMCVNYCGCSYFGWPIPLVLDCPFF